MSLGVKQVACKLFFPTLISGLIVSAMLFVGHNGLQQTQGGKGLIVILVDATTYTRALGVPPTLPSVS